MRLPRPCVHCGRNRVAWSKPRVDLCYDCLPGGPFPPPPCSRCAANDRYFSGGLCQRCHRDAPKRLDTCRDCYAWGIVSRKNHGRCGSCVHWARQYPTGTCATCGRDVALHPTGHCRLCWRQATLIRRDHGPVTVEEANKHGQQLFFASMVKIQVTIRSLSRPPPTAPQPTSPPTTTRSLWQRTNKQLPLLYLPRDFRAGHERGFPEPPDSALVAILSQELADYATRHGWQPEVAKRARRAMHKLLSIQDHPGDKIKVSQLTELNRINLPILRIRDFLAAHDLLDDDTVPALDAWFVGKTADLPEPMRDELRRWRDILWHGSATAPRSHPRQPNTIQRRLNAAQTILRGWAIDNGYESLREIKRTDVLAALDTIPAGTQRYSAASALRSIFKTLRAHRVVFRDPTLHIRLGANFYRTIVPGDLAAIRESLHSSDVTTAALTALLAFHALRSGQLRTLKRTDVRDGRLFLTDRAIPLAEPVRARLASYLDYRDARWPNTANPHLFIHVHIAGGVTPASNKWIATKIGTSARSVRTDRIIQEVQASGGDVRRICDMFGLTVHGAAPYLAVLEHPDLTDPDKTR